MNPAVEEIKSRINIVDFISEYLKMQKSGTNWKANCPFHREKSPSFMVSEEKQIWHCFGCGKGGDVFGFLMEMESVDFKEALRMLAEKTGVELPRYTKSGETAFAPDSTAKILAILELATKFYEKQLWDGVGKEKILNYLRERGLQDETIREFRLGYAPDGWRNILNFLTERGYSSEEIMATGLLVKKQNDQDTRNNNQLNPKSDYYDRFRDRIMFPIQDVMGRVVGYSGRVAPGQDESQAKYVNTPETAVYHKSKILYGLDKAKRPIKEQGFSLVVEGNMDVIASHQAGLKNTVAVSGTALTSEQLDLLKRYSENIKLLFDMDSAGEEAIARSALLAFQKDANVSVVRLPEGKDAAEVVQKNPQKLEEAVKKSVLAMEYLLEAIINRNDKRNPAGKKTIAKEALNFIKEFQSDIERQYWLKKLAEELEVEENALQGVLHSVGQRLKGENRKIVAPVSVNHSLADRQEKISETLAGTLLIDKELWQQAEEKIAARGIPVTNPLLQLVLEQGSASVFSLEKLIASSSDEGVKQKIQNLFFESRYQVGANGELVEVELEEIRQQFGRCLAEMEKELLRARLKTIERDIKKAESAGDQEALQWLINEFSQISKQVKQ